MRTITTKTALKKYKNPIVIGGGILGSSVIYHLSKLGYDVKWFEHMPHGWFSTSFAAGMIVHNKNGGIKSLMAKQTCKDIQELESKLDENLGFVNCGSFHFSHKDVEKEKINELQDFDFSPINVETLPKYPNYNSLDGYIDPCVLLGAYKRASTNYTKYTKKVDELIVENNIVDRICGYNNKVIGINVSGNKVIGVRSGDDEYFGDVIDCTGSWMGNLAIAAGIISNRSHLPVKSHYITLKYLPSPKQLPFILTNDFYIRHNGDDEFFLGIYEEKSEFYEYELSTDWTAYDFINNGRLDSGLMNKLITDNYGLIENIFPDINSVEIHNYIAGFSNYTPDGNYLVGKVCDGLFFAGGDCGSGISSSGGIGKMIAQKSFIKAFEPKRFNNISHDSLISRSVSARKNKFI